MVKKILTLVLAVLSVAALSITPAQAQQDNQLYYFGNLCDGLQCLNNTLGNAAADNPVQWWNYSLFGEPDNDWNVWDAGHVECTANSFPFYSKDVALLTDCLNYWNGDFVFKIAFAPNGVGSGFCIDASSALAPPDSADFVDIDGCQPAYSQYLEQYFIYSSSDWLVSVFATYLSYAAYGHDNTYWLGTCKSGGTQNTERVCVTDLEPVAFTFRPKP